MRSGPTVSVSNDARTRWESYSPNANVRSVVDLQGSVSASSRLGLRRREGEVRLAAAVKDTILVEAHTKRVSIPSVLG